MEQNQLKINLKWNKWTNTIKNYGKIETSGFKEGNLELIENSKTPIHFLPEENICAAVTIHKKISWK